MTGQLVDGAWTTQSEILASSDGRYRRQETSFRNWISSNPGARFKPEADRYRLYVSYACPWAHRTLIFRNLKGLDEAITVSVVNPVVGENGWEFTDSTGRYPDHANEQQFLHQIYTLADRDYCGRVSVPVLWDKKLKTIVSNESAEIIRMFNSAFNSLATNDTDYAPDQHLADIDAVNEQVYQKINNGVYKCGFASTQEAYEEAVGELFEALDTLEARLGDGGYLVGETQTEADWRLFTTLIRFDPVYVALFKCNLRRIADYPNLSSLMRRLYETGDVKDTVDFDQIKTHYYASLRAVNPSGIIPVGPAVAL
jgi:putative glutathione S-transferase